LAAATTNKVVVVPASFPSRRRLTREKAPHQSPTVPLTVVDPDKTGLSNFYNFCDNTVTNVQEQQSKLLLIGSLKI
jgi:hypothetical protein